MSYDECETPPPDEQDAFWHWVESQIHLETSTTNDAECVCNLGE